MNLELNDEEKQVLQSALNMYRIQLNYLIRRNISEEVNLTDEALEKLSQSYKLLIEIDNKMNK